MAVVVQRVREAPDAVWQLAQRRSRQALAVVEQGFGRLLVSVVAVLAVQVGDPPLPQALCGDLRVEVAAPLVRCAHVAQDQIHRLFDEFAVPIETDRRNHEAFLDQLASNRHRPRRHPADVRLMRATGDITNRCVVLASAVREDRRDHRHVGQMGAAEERIVEDRQIAGPPRLEPLDGAHRFRHRAEVHGNMGGLGQ